MNHFFDALTVLRPNWAAPAPFDHLTDEIKAVAVGFLHETGFALDESFDAKIATATDDQIRDVAKCMAFLSGRLDVRDLLGLAFLSSSYNRKHLDKVAEQFIEQFGIHVEPFKMPF